MGGLLKTFANLKNTESFESKHYGQVSYIPDSLHESSHFYLLRNFQEISAKMKLPVSYFARAREGVAGPVARRPGVCFPED